MALIEALDAYWARFKQLKNKPADDTVSRDVLEIQWKHIRDVGDTINLKWLDPLVEGEAAECEYEIDGTAHGLLVEPVIPMLGGERKRRLREYQKHAEKVALGRWHTARGTPVTERDLYQTEPGFVEPRFVWADTKPVRKVKEAA